jgi:hypothetical protein
MMFAPVILVMVSCPDGFQDPDRGGASQKWHQDAKLTEFFGWCEPARALATERRSLVACRMPNVFNASLAIPP